MTSEAWAVSTSVVVVLDCVVIGAVLANANGADVDEEGGGSGPRERMIWLEVE